MADFAKILAGPLEIEKPKRIKNKRKKCVSAQEQKYSKVPRWRRRPGGHKGQMK